MLRPMLVVGMLFVCAAMSQAQPPEAKSETAKNRPAPVRVEGAQSFDSPSFVNEVEPILTRFGCNQGACHGKGSGQNGFRLSLRGYAPEWDHAWITKEFSSRRINASEPKASLLLQKPTGQALHAGGVLFSEQSRAYQRLLAWIEAGAKGSDGKEPGIRKLTLLPGDRRLSIGTVQPLTALAEFADGTSADVTWLTKFESSDSAVASVTADGVIKMHRPGEASVRGMFLGQASVVLVSAPFNHSPSEAVYAKRNNFIDEHVFGKLKELRIEPSEDSNDAMFLRRVYLDLIGVLPTLEEKRAFAESKDSAKRAKVIDQLLERPEFVDLWTMLLADMLQNRKERDHDVRGSKGVRAFHEWLRRQVASNRPWDEVCRDLLTATGTTHEHPGVGYFIVNVGEHRESHRSPVGAAAAQAFLGVRIGCAECHNHPLEKYTQDDFHHFAGFFSRVKLERDDPKKKATKLVVSMSDLNQNKNPVGVTQPRTGKFLAPRPLDRQEVKVSPGDDPRKALAEWITRPDNEYFAGAMINRLWGYFFDVGLVNPIDDLRASNPPSNPALWNALIKEFVASKFDRKHMIRLIVNSRAYQLSSKTLPSNATDRRFYSHFYSRRMYAEVLFDVYGQVLDYHDRFDGYPSGLRAVQLPDPGAAAGVAYFSSIARPTRVTGCDCEREREVNLTSALHLLGSERINVGLQAPEGRLAKVLKSSKSDDEITRELFAWTLDREPTPEEWKLMRDHRAKAPDQRSHFTDVFWAILNTRDFLFVR